jgi:hypothetical protein
VRIYSSVFTTAEQCTEVIGGTWDDVSAYCAVP